MLKYQTTKTRKFQIYKFKNFEGTHVEIAKEQKSKFQLCKFINLKNNHIKIGKDRKSNF